jgi:hypothetical protein
LLALGLENAPELIFIGQSKLIRSKKRNAKSDGHVNGSLDGEEH